MAGQTINKSANNPYNLSDREMKIISMVAKGLTSKQIAVKLGVSARTVEVHRYNCMKKTDSKNSIVLVRRIIE